MMTIGHCANKVSVCFVQRNPRSCAGLIFCIVFLFLFFQGVVNAHAKHRNGVPEGLPTPTQSTQMVCTRVPIFVYFKSI